MTSRAEQIDSGFRATVLVSICIIIYAGPASVFSLSKIFNDDFFGDLSTFEATIWVGVVWMFAIPLFLAYQRWDSNAAGSTMWMAIFLVVMLLLWLVLRSLMVAILALALAAPFHLWIDGEPYVDALYYAAVVLSAFVYIIIPLAAIAFQLSRSNDWDNIRY